MPGSQPVEGQKAGWSFPHWLALGSALGALLATTIASALSRGAVLASGTSQLFMILFGVIAATQVGIRLFTGHFEDPPSGVHLGSLGWLEASIPIAVCLDTVGSFRGSPLWAGYFACVLGVAWLLVQAGIARRLSGPGRPERLLVRFLYNTRCGLLLLDVWLVLTENVLVSPLRQATNALVASTGRMVTAAETLLSILLISAGLLVPTSNLAASLTSRVEHAQTTATTTTTTTPEVNRQAGGTTDHGRPLTTTARPSFSFETICGPGAIQPGQGLPETDAWASAILRTAYFGQGGYGANTAGCPTTPEVTSDSYSSVIYQAGYLDGVLESVSVACGRDVKNSAVFLGQVASYVLDQLQAGTATCGSSRLDVGYGDVQLVYEVGGTTAFVREDNGNATPYQVLQPAEVSAWVAAMTAARAWLWPVPESSGYQLLASWSRVPMGVIQPQPGAAATLSQSSASGTYFPTNVELSQLLSSARIS